MRTGSYAPATGCESDGRVGTQRSKSKLRQSNGKVEKWNGGISEYRNIDLNYKRHEIQSDRY